MNNVKNAVADQLYGKDGTASTPDIYKNGQALADKVINNMSRHNLYVSTQF